MGRFHVFFQDKSIGFVAYICEDMFQGNSIKSVWDLILPPFILAFIYIFESQRVRNKIEIDSKYEFYLKGLFFRIAGALVLCIIYQFYYIGGDTINYWGSGVIVNRMIWKDLWIYFKILAGDRSWENYAAFDVSTSYPDYMARDAQSFAVVRFVSPFCFLTIRSYYSTSILVAWFTYGGIWRLYTIFSELFPDLKREFAYSTLFIPSISFWGGGILKDTFSLWSGCLFIYGFYRIFVCKTLKFKYFFLLVFAAYIMISIKPYIFISLLPTCLLWLLGNRLKAVDSGFAKTLIAPFFIATSVVIVGFIFGQMSDQLGDYASVDKTIQKAAVTQQDLKRSEYGGNSFDIGTFDGSVGSMITLFPKALFAGIFRPTIFDVRNPVMFVSALENLFLSYTVLKAMLAAGLIGFWRKIFSQPILMASILFVFFFGFAVGLTTSNFGSLVRYRIPLVPFLLTSMFIIRYLVQKEQFESDNPDINYDELLLKQEKSE